MHRGKEPCRCSVFVGV
uniref:Uncharacterized protein n=1 Tax=Rhizophora mucronata TaxID=61149 RepID=A0A2P2N8C8_RHIMU